jgi:hypothetical protein
MREGQVLVDERARGQRLGVELARREQDLAVLAIDPVPIVVDRYEVVVRADLLQLPKGAQQRRAIPQAHVLDGGRVGAQRGERERRDPLEVARLYAVDPPRASRGGDVALQVGGSRA